MFLPKTINLVHTKCDYQQPYTTILDVHSYKNYVLYMSQDIIFYDKSLNGPKLKTYWRPIGFRQIQRRLDPSYGPVDIARRVFQIYSQR